MQNRFVIEGRLPSLNDYINACRSHWSKGAKFKEDVETTIIWAIRSAKAKGECRPVTKPVRITFFWHERDKKRDIDNIYSAKKYILDAMQKAGIIQNDDRKHVIDVDDHIYDAFLGKDCVAVYIHEVEE